MRFLPKETEVVMVVAKLLPLVVYGYIKALIMFFVPSRYKWKKDIRGQTVLITGAGNGIGRELAIEMSRLSVNLVLLDLDMESLKHTAKLLDTRSKFFLHECDVTERQKVYQVAERVKDKVGNVDILVNNAGVVYGKKILDLSDDKIQKTMEVNALAHFWTCRAFLPEMMKQNKGHIVCVASMAGLSGFPFLTDYSASKFAAVGFMESLVLELASKKLDGIKVTMVCPSFIRTGLFEGMKPPLTVSLSPDHCAKEIVNAVLEEKELKMIPDWTYVIILLKWTMPEIAVKGFYRNSGLLNFMDEFKGRKNITENNGVIKNIPVTS